MLTRLVPFLIGFAGSAGLAAETVDFNRDIRPILSENCFHCHGPDAAERKGDLRLDTQEGALAAIQAGHPEASELIARIQHEDPDERMPPPASKRSLTATQQKQLVQWIEDGAAWAQHWAFVPPVRPEVPPGAAHPVDAFVQARLAPHDIAPKPEAPPATLLRRVTLDLTGLPPTPDEVDAFLHARERDPEAAYAAVVDRLLASPRYGEHMALNWLDAARYADTDGYQYDGPRFMWRWRDWVIEAYNQHMPFDQFTIEQLAGDLLDTPSVEQRIATGFNRNHRYNSESGLVVEEFLLENAVDRVDTTSTLWMGLTLGCARCHDHKYDPISTKDYYQLIAFFNSIPEGGRAVKARNSAPFMPAPNRDQQQEVARLERKVAATRAALETDETRAAIEDWAARVAAKETKVDRPLLLPKRSFRAPLDGVEKGIKAVAGTVRFTPGVFGQALQFDGTNIVSLSTPAAMSGFKANQKFSIAFWLKAEQDGVVFSRQKPGHGRPGVALEWMDGHLQFDLVSRWIAGVGRVTTKAPLPKGQWMHLTVTSDGSQNAAGQRVYVDGHIVETEVGFNINSNVGGAEKQPIRLGGGVAGGPRFTGAVDELRVYNRVLWPEEVPALSERVFVERIATKPAAKRTPDETVKMRTWYFEHAAEPPVKKRHEAAIAARMELETYIGKLPDVMVMQESPQPKRTFIRERGVYDALGGEVWRNVPEALPPLRDDARRDRLGFARWLVSGEHPLTARVAVNRYWLRYFGTGLVKTAEDFGVQGEAPSHPDLLDWLATEFVRSDWDVAAMQKLILTSQTYRQASTARPELTELDPHNRLLARGPRLRLTGHALRDQALFVSGLLKERVGGPSVSPYQPANLWAEMSMGMRYKQSKGDDLYRRSLYTIWKRTVAPPAMAVFDAADREQCWVKSQRTNTPLQALTLLNETGFVESARALADRMLRAEDPLGFGFKSVTARLPTPRERAVLDQAWERYRKAFANDLDAAKALIASGASTPAKDLDPKELAATTTLANVLLNLDEAITRE